MTVKLLTEHHAKFLSLKEAAQACRSLHLSKCDIVGHHMLLLICFHEKILKLNFNFKVPC